MTLTSTAWRDGGQIPPKYAQPGEEVSPPLAWTGVPDSIVSFALLAHDVDAAIGSGVDDLLQQSLLAHAFEDRGPGTVDVGRLRERGLLLVG